MKKNRAQKDIFYISLSSFILVVAWIGFSLYHRWTTSTITEDLQLQLTPITATFDTQVIQTLKKRTDVTPLYEVLSPAEGITPSPSVTPGITASSSAETETVTETVKLTPIPSKIPTRSPTP